jgi:hypothetical protein
MGRHRPSGLLTRRAIRTPLILIAALGLISAGTIILRSVAADADGCSSSGIRLTVAADPAIAPAIAEIGAKWTATDPSIDGECVRVDVVAKASYDLAEGWGTWAGGLIDIAAKPAPTPAETDLPVVWVPDSSYWLGRVRAIDQQLFDIVSPSIASSPVVLAIAESKARTLNQDLSQGVDAAKISQLALNLRGENLLRLGVVEPRRDTAGMVGAMVMADALVASDKDLPALVLAYRKLGAQVNDTQALWREFGRATEPLDGAPVSEQALLAYNAGGTTSPMAAVTIGDAPTLDFPYAIRSAQPRQTTAAAAAFRAVLTSQPYRTVLAQHRLRSADGSTAPGFPTGHGVTTVPVHVQPLTDMAKVKKALGVWVAARTPSRIVAMVDATSSMSQLMGGGKSRMQVMREASVRGLSLFTDDSLLGLWAFAGPGHRPMVPLAPLGPPNVLGGQRAKLTAAIGLAAPGNTDASPLYQSILAGYQEVLREYNPDLSNTLVIFTDGKDSTGLELAQVQRDLEVLADVTRPVRVVLLGMGPEVDHAALESIARTTGGAAFSVSTADEMETIFLLALLT